MLTHALAVQTFATADWRNWISSMQIGLFEIATRIGIPPLENTSLNQGLSLVYSTLESTARAFEQSEDPSQVAADVAGNIGLQVVAQIVGQSNLITMVAALVYQAACWAVDAGGRWPLTTTTTSHCRRCRPRIRQRTRGR